MSDDAAAAVNFSTSTHDEKVARVDFQRSGNTALVMHCVELRACDGQLRCAMAGCVENKLNVEFYFFALRG